VLLLAALLLYFCVLEAVTRMGFAHVSHIQARIVAHYGQALQLQPTGSDASRTILLVGNSILVHGVDHDKLEGELAPDHVVELSVENTFYLDWYFGMRRLFSQGSRPAILVLCLSSQQLISPSTDGEYFAHYLMDRRDLVRVKREGQLDMTMASNLFFANLSSWLGSRSGIRNWLLGEIMPDIAQLTNYLPETAPPMPPDNIVLQQALPRLQAMQRLCEEHGTRFVFLIPPLREPDESSEAIQAAATHAGITVLFPYRQREFTASYFSDAIHLNERGASLFTEKFAPALHRMVSQN
jgi:hypothetical protein